MELSPYVLGGSFLKGEKMQEQLKQLKEQAMAEISKVDGKASLNEFRVKYLGKQGLLTQILRGMRDVPAEQRPVVGALVNEVRALIEEQLSAKEVDFEKREMESELAKNYIDITEPAQGHERGALHPLSKVFELLIDSCVNMGFKVVEGPEVELDYYNFEALNIPKNHPSRDMQDTFFVTDNILLRSQTSSVQARAMEVMKPPFKIISPGRVYRNDSDATHSPVFHQMEGLVIDENISMADLKAMLIVLMRKTFGEQTQIRFRPSFFPFTEPSVEVDVTCPSCHGEGCRLCKGTGFMELLGAGIVNPKVLEANGIDSKKYRGFAFGFGVDRVAMVKNGIADIRSMFKNDIRFLKQMK